MFSWTQGKPVAAVCGGPLDGRILHVTTEAEEPDRSPDNEDIYDILSEGEFALTPGQYKLLPLKDRQKLKKAMATKQEPLDQYLVEPYKKGSAKLKELLKKEVSVPGDGVMVIMPARESERIMIAGMSGSGKSCLAAMYMREYREMHPKRNIILISSHDDEKAYQQIDHIAMPLSDFLPDPETGLVDMPSVIDLKESLIVFDDCDNISDKVLSKNILALNDDLIANGRKYDIHVLTLSHHLMNYSKTRNLLMEANKVVFFQAGTSYHVKEFLKKYAGLDPKTIVKVCAIHARWIMLAQCSPMYIIHEHGALLL